MKVLRYSSDDFTFRVPVRHSCTGDGRSGSGRFDVLLCSRWNEARDAGYFRYRLDGPEALPTRILDGRHGFVVQLNEKRGVQRRAPQDIVSVSQPFDERLFNFIKVAEREVLFQLMTVDSSLSDRNLALLNGRQLVTSSKVVPVDRHLLVINISPLEYGNSLLVPFVDSQLPQVLTREGLEMGIEMVLMSSTPAFRVGFNSLCANASVNHHHLHVYYLGYKLAAETIAVTQLIGDCYEISGDYPAVGYAFHLTRSSDIRRLTELVFSVSSYFQANDIPHNLFVTRGARFDVDQTVIASDDVQQYDAIRVFLWAREPVYGIKDDLAFNVACCELAGHLPIKREDSFHEITEIEVCRELDIACGETYRQVRPAVIALLRDQLLLENGTSSS